MTNDQAKPVDLQKSPTKTQHYLRPYAPLTGVQGKRKILTQIFLKAKAYIDRELARLFE